MQLAGGFAGRKSDTIQSIAIIGVGYVGLPLSVGFSKYFQVTAYDRNSKRIDELKNGIDSTHEAASSSLRNPQLLFTNKTEDLKNQSIFIVTVPTPVDAFHVPDLEPLQSACELIGPYLSKGATVVFESTVYPGLTEEVLAPKLEKVSGLKFNKDFFLGYSPERVNPGDKVHTLSNIQKIVAGSTPQTLELLFELYSKIITVGVVKVSNIATAEAAKVIENIQRDVNIGLINELTVLFDRLNLDVHEVLDAASTKWNFMKFKPGLVGGHCIGVDPFYLTHKANQVGYHPEMILAGRRINDSMAAFYAEKFVKELVKRKVNLHQAEVLVLGFTFKENCPDIRNTKVCDLVTSLQSYGLKVDVVDPLANPNKVKQEYGVLLSPDIPKKKYHGIVFAVPHQSLLSQGADNAFKQHLLEEGLVLDIKAVLKKLLHVIH